jgi:hypothetical protein
MKENVIFQKVKEATTVRARWMVAFVEDLLPFERFLNKTHHTTVIALKAVRLLLIEVRSSSLTVPNRKLSAFPTIGISPLLYLNFFSTGLS